MQFTSRFFIAIFVIVVSLFSCSEKEKTITSEESFVSYVTNSPSSIIFGKVVLKDLIENLAFQDLPKLNVLLSKEVSTISKGFDLKEPIYFSIDSLFHSNGRPTSIFLFMKVKNKDLFADKLSSLGYLIEPGKESMHVIGNNLSGKITNSFAILHLSEKASKRSVNQALSKSNLSLDPQIKKLVVKKTSLSLHIHLEHLQKLLDNQTLERPISKKEELIALYKNSFISSDFNLKNETLIGDIKFNFNSYLKKRLFFKTNAQKNLSYIAKNDFVSGIGISIDPLKADLFINDFYPSLLSNLSGNNFSIQLAIMSLGSRPISNLTNGSLAFAYHDLGIPTCSIELGNKANELKKISTPYLSHINIGQIHFEGNTLLNTTLIKNNQSEFFKKSNDGILFVYDSKNDTKLRNLDDKTKFLDAISTFTITLNNNGGTIIIKGKKQKEGLLHQITEEYIKEIKEVVR